MGYTMLYIAFGVVALWLLGEVLLQYKAPLPWRVGAFLGFLCVVAGVALRSVVVIGVGAVAFAVGQTFVTVAYRQGYSEGWSLTGPRELTGSGQSRQRARHEPALRVSEVEPAPVASPTGAAAYRDIGSAAGYRDPSVPVYHPTAMAEDSSGEYEMYAKPRAEASARPQTTSDLGPQPSYAADGYAAPPTALAADPYGPGYAYAGYDEYGGQQAGSGTPADRTMAMPTYQDPAFVDPASQEAGLGGGSYAPSDQRGTEGPLQDAGYPGPAYQGGEYSDSVFFQDPAAYRATDYQEPFSPQSSPEREPYQDRDYPDAAYPASFEPQAPQDFVGQRPAAYLDPGRDSGEFPQAAYLDPGQYRQPAFYDPYAVDPQRDQYTDGTPPGGLRVPQQQSGEQQVYAPPPAPKPGEYDPYRS